MQLSIILTVAPPAAGKSTWAKKFCKRKGWLEVNRDEIRQELYGPDYKHSTECERVVTKTQKQMALNALDEGQSVVVSDTNVNPKTREIWKQIAKGKGVAYFEKHFKESYDFDLLLERNAARAESEVVPEHVIKNMYVNYREQNFKPYPGFQPGLPSAYIFDIDGTLALMGDRSPYDWHRVGEDEVNIPVWHIMSDISMSTMRPRIILLSGRDCCCTSETESWLESEAIVYDELHMRPAGSHMKDSVVKYDLFKEHVEGKYNVIAVFDDRNQVVDMWRKIGLTCCQVAPGDF